MNKKYWFECVKCGKEYDADEVRYLCDCGSILDVKYDYESLGLDRKKILSRPLGVWRYKEFMPLKPESRIISFNEGGTGLHKCDNLAKELGLKELYIKNEGENPTGSFKDRGMTLGVSKALELGVKLVGCASTGNTSASLAAYSARAGIRCAVLIPAGKIAYGKLAQALIYGAEVYAIEGNFDDAMAIVKSLGEKGIIYLLNSMNPFRLEGQRTLGYEILDEINPDRIFIPVGNAGNISAVWKAIQEYSMLGWIDKKPRMHGVQSEGAAPLAKMFEEKSDELVPEENPETVASAIRIGNPVSWQKAIKAARESNGWLGKVLDDEILEAQKLLASKEGIFVEPASAASIAGLKKLVDLGEIDKDERIVCITTGHGLKNPDIAVEQCKENIKNVKADEEEIIRMLGVEK